jgi:uncharacterized protein DUF2510
VPVTLATPAGWYPDQHGVMRFWDGQRWTQHVAPPAPQVYQQPYPVVVGHPNYVRMQHGHSIIAHVFLGWLLLYIPTIYYAISPNHYFHA